MMSENKSTPQIKTFSDLCSNIDLMLYDKLYLHLSNKNLGALQPLEKHVEKVLFSALSSVWRKKPDFWQLDRKKKICSLIFVRKSTLKL